MRKKSSGRLIVAGSHEDRVGKVTVLGIRGRSQACVKGQVDKLNGVEAIFLTRPAMPEKAVEKGGVQESG